MTSWRPTRPRAGMVGGLLLVVLCAAALPAHARVERFALLVGNNRGSAGDVELRYAEADAERMRETLQHVGGFDADHVVLLASADADTVRRALISLNDRIRGAIAAGNDVGLIVYYSGHADSTRLHLGSTTLELGELEQLVRGSAATLRLLIVDACRSGQLTRLKGGKRVAPISVSVDDRLAGQGMVVLSATAANEDAQESDALGASFFTHALVSGLLGAADRDADGLVVLEEAYQYAYEATLRSTIQSASGPQHPSFRIDLRGQNKVVLADLTGHPAERALLYFPPGRSYLVMKGAAEGRLVAELGSADSGRWLALRPGKYFVRARAATFLLEGDVEAVAGQRLEVRDASLRRLEYARRVRKGGSEGAFVHGPQLGYRMRTAFANAEGLCHGAFVGYALELRQLSFVPRLVGCRGGFATSDITANSDDIGFDARFVRAWDLPFVTIEASATLRTSLLRQTFETRGLAPPRSSISGGAGAGVGVSRDLFGGTYVFAEVEGMVSIFRLQQSTGSTNTLAAFAIASGIGVGRRW